VLVVRDREGAIFGGYSGCTWKDPDIINSEAAAERRVMNRPGATSAPKPTGMQHDPGFHGDHECFVFTLRPEQAAYKPTAKNMNYKVLQTKYPEEDKNGIGFGGMQLGFHGLFLHSDLDKGYCRGTPNDLTYDSPCLASSRDFEIDSIEAWLVGRDEDEVVSVTVAPKTSRGENQDVQEDLEILRHAGIISEKDRASR